MSLRSLFRRKEEKSVPDTITVQVPPAPDLPPEAPPAPADPIVVEDQVPVHDEVAITAEAPPPAPPIEFGWNAKATELRTLKRLAGVIVDEALVKVEPDGLRVRVMDPAHVCLLDAKMACSTNGEGYFIVRVQDWAFLEKATGPLLAKVKQEQQDGGTDYTMFTLPAEGHTVKVRNQQPRNDGKGPQVPNLNFTASILVPAARLKRLCAMAKGGQVLRIEVEGDVATLQVDEETSVRSSGRRRRRGPSPSKARAVPEATLRISEKETPGYIVRAEGKTRSLFSLDYIEAIVGAAHKDALLTLDLASDFPVRIRWSDGPTSVMFTLAPRIESE